MDIDVEKLATDLAKEEFKKEYEDVLEFDVIYERADDGFAYYLKEKYADIFEKLITKYMRIIESYPNEGEAQTDSE